jgi:hypothetical protein
MMPVEQTPDLVVEEAATLAAVFLAEAELSSCVT